MHLSNRGIYLIASAALFAWTVGCGGQDEYREFDESTDGRPVSHDHEHDHEHDHDHHHHDHDEPGPHGGLLVEMGEHAYHAELLYHMEEGKLTVYLLGRMQRKIIR